MVPSVSLGLHLDPSEFQVAINGWLGVIPLEVPCVLFVLKLLLILLATMQFPACKRGGDAVIRHNQLRDVFTEA